MQVLQRAGDDLGGRGRAAVDQHHQRLAVGEVEARARREGLILIGVAAAGRDDLALGEERVDDLDRLGEQPARVVAQIEDIALELGVARSGS